jgi:branched-subunit amino acid transport protein
MSELGLLVLAACVGTYLWRGIGVALSGRIRPESEVLDWVTCIAYATLAGLISRILLVPGGLLAETALVERLVACALGLAAYYASRRSVPIAVLVGVAAMIALVAFR